MSTIGPTTRATLVFINIDLRFQVAKYPFKNYKKNLFDPTRLKWNELWYMARSFFFFPSIFWYWKFREFSQNISNISQIYNIKQKNSILMFQNNKICPKIIV
jgi:hypothetical protein